MKSNREHNLALIKETVDEIRGLVKGHGKGQGGLHEVFFNPRRREPLYKSEVDFSLTEQYPSFYERKGNNIFALYKLLDGENTATPTVEFQLNVHKRISETLGSQHIEKAEAHVLEYQRELQRRLKTDPKRNDPAVQAHYRYAYNLIDSNLKEIKRNMPPNLDDRDEKNLLRFILGHELAHLTNNHRDSVQWQYMDKANLSGIDKEALSSAFYSLNRHSKDEQHQGANYTSTRDEIRSDIAGLYMLAYSVNKAGEPEGDMMRLIGNLGKMRYVNNISHDSSHASSHITEKVFQEPFLSRILNMARSDAKLGRSPTGLDTRIQDMTEDIFFETLKEKGVVLRNYTGVDGNTENRMKQEGYSVAESYTKQVKIAENIASRKFQECAPQMPQNFLGQCSQYLMGHQNRLMDANKDGIPDSRNLERRLEQIASQKGQSVPQMTGNMIRQEGENLERFIKNNNLKATETSDLDVPALDLNRGALKFAH